MNRRQFLGGLLSLPFLGSAKRFEATPVQSGTTPVPQSDANGNVFTNCVAARGAPYEVYAGERHKGSFETFQEAWTVAEPQDTIICHYNGDLYCPAPKGDV